MPKIFKIWDLDERCWSKQFSFEMKFDKLLGTMEIANHARFIPLQFTGTMDRNNVMIFEEDIVEIELQNEFGSIEKKRGIMRWCENCAKFCAQIDNSYNLIKVTANPLIIGNSFSNPDIAANLSQIHNHTEKSG